MMGSSFAKLKPPKRRQVVKQPEYICKTTFEKLQFKHLNSNHLERIASYLSLGEISQLTKCSRDLYKKLNNPLMDGVWVMNT